MFNIKNKITKDKKISKILKKEKIRQENQVTLIASENYVSNAVLSAQGSIFTNKYAEGKIKNRYYAGCKYVDKIEKIAIERAKRLFCVKYVNVQPHSGTQANFAAYSSVLKYGDTILGMDLSHGGHLTHGSDVNFSGKLYNFIHYKTNKKGEIDYSNIRKLAKKHKPKMIVGGFSSYSGDCNWKKMRKISNEINAFLLVDISHIAGLIIAGLYNNPIPYAHIITSTTHKTLSGPRGGIILSNHDDKNLFKKIDSSVFPGCQGGPLVHVMLAKAIAFKEAYGQKFKNYQIQVIKNVKAMIKIFKKENFKIVSNGSKNHLFLLDLRKNNVTGKEIEERLYRANIVVNKNNIPDDDKKPSITSGIRIGTPAITRRGFLERESQKIAKWIIQIIKEKDNLNTILNIKNKVYKMCKLFPIYKNK
ncbi:serine hydroxymethyltransferase [Buchnera aphidicola (Ceratoglyphina bambusae)]|uniref:serine hydroxymethyltransferase n=1 Tax=Buchnera aphidicola TaxID=9 RepID=UPI0031B87C10